MSTTFDILASVNICFLHRVICDWLYIRSVAHKSPFIEMWKWSIGHSCCQISAWVWFGVKDWSVRAAVRDYVMHKFFSANYQLKGSDTSLFKMRCFFVEVAIVFCHWTELFDCSKLRVASPKLVFTFWHSSPKWILIARVNWYLNVVSKNINKTIKLARVACYKSKNENKNPHCYTYWVIRE